MEKKREKGTKKSGGDDKGRKGNARGRTPVKGRNNIMQKSEASRYCPRLLREDENRKQTFVGA